MDMKRIRVLYFGAFSAVKRCMIKSYLRKNIKRNTHNANILTADEVRAAKAFFAPYCKIHPFCHAYYKEKVGKFDPAYLPSDVYVNHIDEYFNDRIASQVMDNKCYYPQLFGLAGIAQAENVALYIGGLWYDGQMQLIGEEEAKRRISEQAAVFVKAATDSSGGQGVFRVTNENGSIFDNVKEKLGIIKGDTVIQKPLKQHEAIAAINASSVNTLRILSLLTDEGVKIYSAVLRMGVAGADVDNTAQGGMTCGIDENGRLKKYAYRHDGTRYDVHPTSDVVFEGYTVPSFEAAKDLVRKAHPMVPHFRLVSWDIAIDESGEAVMIEANLAKGGLTSHQFNNGPLFGEDTKQILDEVFSRGK